MITAETIQRLKSADGLYVLADSEIDHLTMVVVSIGGRLFALAPKYELSSNPENYAHTMFLASGPHSAQSAREASTTETEADFWRDLCRACVPILQRSVDPDSRRILDEIAVFEAAECQAANP